MKEKALRFLKDPTSIHIAVNTIGNYLNVAFTAVFAIILVRIMTPAQYGELSVLLGIAYVMASVLEFGTVATIYSTIPDLYLSKSKRIYQFVKSTFVYQSSFSLLVLGILFVFFPQLNVVFFKTHATGTTLSVTVISALFFIWQNFCTNILFAAKKFTRANVYLNTANVVKLGAILLLAQVGKIDVSAVIVIFGIVGPLVFFAMAFAKSGKHIVQAVTAPVKKEEFKFKYTFTYFLATQFYNVGLRMDLFLLSFYGLRNEVGYYALSQKIILSIITSIVSITQVLSPGFAVVKTKTAIVKQLKKGLLYMLVPCAVFLALFVTPASIFSLVFTENFGETAAITHVLSLPFILNALGSVPMLFLLYTVKKPVPILIGNIFFFVAMTVGSYVLIPQYGVFGPPIAITIGFLLAIAIQLVISYRYIISYT